MPSRRCRRPTALALLGLAIALPGCAQMATVRCWQPAEGNVAGIQRIAVVDFRGETGAKVAAAVSDRLWSNRCYALVDQSELMGLQHAAYVPDPGDQSFLTQARERGIDGLVFGEILKHEYVGATATEDAAGPSHGGQGEVSIQFRLVDTRTGEVRAEQTVTHRYAGTERPDGSASPGGAEVLAKLTTMCVDDFLLVLTPHQAEESMQLASARWYTRGASAIRCANRSAASGDWDAARDKWQDAVDRDGTNDVALYNLSLDAAQRQQFDQAEELAMRAIRIRHTDQYAAGLARIREYRTCYDEIAKQRDQRVLQAAR